MKKLLYISFGLILGCFVTTTAAAQTPAKDADIKKVEEAPTKPQKVEGTTEAKPVKTKQAVRTRAISIDEEGMDEAEPKKASEPRAKAPEQRKAVQAKQKTPKLQEQ